MPQHAATGRCVRSIERWAHYYSMVQAPDCCLISIAFGVWRVASCSCWHDRTWPSSDLNTARKRHAASRTLRTTFSNCSLDTCIIMRLANWLVALCSNQYTLSHVSRNGFCEVIPHKRSQAKEWWNIHHTSICPCDADRVYDILGILTRCTNNRVCSRCSYYKW